MNQITAAIGDFASTTNTSRAYFDCSQTAELPDIPKLVVSVTRNNPRLWSILTRKEAGSDLGQLMDHGIPYFIGWRDLKGAFLAVTDLFRFMSSPRNEDL